MLTFTLYLLLAAAAAAAAAPYTPTDYFLLDCGSSSSTASPDGRTWDGDTNSKFSPPNIAATSSAFTADQQNPSVAQVPFLTARIFNSNFTYSFPVSSGPKFLRLYFYPTNYSGTDTSHSFFSVTAGVHYTLLNNFSASLTVSSITPQQFFLIKEFIVTVNSQSLDVSFAPSPNSFAFINAIEVVSMPENLYFHGGNSGLSLIGSNQFFNVDNRSALETLFRLNVGGSFVAGNNDTGLYRTWYEDQPYIYGGAVGVTSYTGGKFPIRYTVQTPEYTAPETVYSTWRSMGNNSYVNLNYNLTWIFPVDSGFGYLVRLHFCEVQIDMTKQNGRAFSVFLENQTAVKELDVYHESGGNGFPIFKEFYVRVPDDDGRRSKKDLWVALHPNIQNKPDLYDAFLNGLEIFKLNHSDGSLAGPNPELVVVATPSNLPVNPKNKESSSPVSVLPIVLGAVLGGLAVVSILGFLIFQRQRKVRDSRTSLAKSSWVPFSVSYKTSTSTNTDASSLPSNLCKHFTLHDIRSATRNFDDDLVIGTGGFGNVYKGFINNDALTVAIKRLNPSSNQGAREFQTEIRMLSKLRHLHLVSLIGYCDDGGEMILVYDYMAHGTLRDHLYRTENPPLTWKQRLRICIGAARGIHYLHTGAKHMIIHRDVKSTNILLDEKWVAKVSDFGLSKMGPTDLSRSHVSTVVKGSFGYVDPEYYRRQQLTEKSDVYSFGVVLLEVLCARPAVITGLPKEQVSLAEWGRYCWRKGIVDQIVDPNLRGQIASESLRKFGETVDSCLRDSGIERPMMSDVIWSLEFALQLQEAAEGNINGGDDFGLSPSVPLLKLGDSTPTDDEDMFSVSKTSGTSTVDSGEKSQTVVFSEINNPKGR